MTKKASKLCLNECLSLPPNHTTLQCLSTGMVRFCNEIFLLLLLQTPHSHVPVIMMTYWTVQLLWAIALISLTCCFFCRSFLRILPFAQMAWSYTQHLWSVALASMNSGKLGGTKAILQAPLWIWWQEFLPSCLPGLECTEYKGNICLARAKSS